MHVELNARFELDVPSDKTVPLATIAEVVTEQDIEAALLEAIVETIDEQCVRERCGEKHADGNGDERYQRRGTRDRSAVTTAGDHEFTLHYVEDTAAGTDETAYFRPVEDVLSFNGQKQYQEDIAVQSIDLATSLSYRDAEDHGDSLLSMPSADTINRRVREYGSKLTEFLPECIEGTEADAVLADGTKCHSQDPDRSYQTVQATLGDTGADSTTLLDVSVNGDWDDIATSLTDIAAVTDDTTVVSDAADGLVNGFTDVCRDHQHDLVHSGRTLGYNLWDDGVFSLEERNAIVAEVNDELFHLKNSVEKHRPAEEYAAIRDRIATTKARLRKTAWQLSQASSDRAATYLREWLPSMLTFATHALDGVAVPWTSNPVERAMGEISKRCKNQWMAWTELGLEALLQLQLVRYANPDHYQAFLNEVLERSTKTTMTCALSVRPTRGEL